MHTALAALLDPAAAAALAADWLDAASGGASSGCYGWEREVMLHHPGQYPRGALCPAQLLLLPSSGGSLGSTSSGAAMEVDAEDGASGASHVQACLWVHPAAAAEAHAALRQAAAGPQVCLEVPNVRRLELRGGAADTALAVALAGATASGIASSSGSGGGRGTVRKQQQQKRAAAAQQHQHEQQQQEALPPPPLPPALAGMGHGDAVQLQLPDPRLCKPVALGSAAGSLLEAAGAAAGSSSLDEPQPLDVGRLLQAPLPLTESELSSRRQQLRRSMLQLETAPGSSSTAADGQQQGQQQAERQAREVQRRGYCPALLVRHEPRERRAAPGEQAAGSRERWRRAAGASHLLLLAFCLDTVPAPVCPAACRLVAHPARRLGAPLLAGGRLRRLQARRPARVALAAHAGWQPLLPLGLSRHSRLCRADVPAAAEPPGSSGAAAQG